LQAELARKRKARQADFGGRKFVRRSDLTAAREARLREEEAASAPAPAPAAAVEQVTTTAVAAATEAAGTTGSDGAAEARASEGAEAEAAPPSTTSALLLDKAEVVRRLRLLGEPATLFGEGERERALRLDQAVSNLELEDVTMGGGTQMNQQLALVRKMEEIAKRRALAGTSKKKEEEEEEDPTMAAFKAAAKALKRQRKAQQALSLEPPDQIVEFFKGLVKEWQEEIAAISESDLVTIEGKQTVANFTLTKEALKPLYSLLRERSCPADIERALWLIVKAMRVRNYREAGDIYLRLAIGNSAWPIGVTQVGIHHRSAREKISTDAQAHIMHDEQTRKYMQATKRLITFSQRKYPSAPSLSIDFNSGANGSDKAALIAAKDSEQLLLTNEAFYKDAPSAEEDGWRAHDGDNRTWHSIMKHAYGDYEKELQKRKVEVQLDTTMYSTKAGYIGKDGRHTGATHRK